MQDSPIVQFLAPLARLATKSPHLEAAVLWGDATGWQVQDDTTETLDAEEMAFYAEGLLLEGFGMVWQVMATAEAPKEPGHVVLMFWEGAAPPPPPPAPDGWLVLSQDAWAGSKP